MLIGVTGFDDHRLGCLISARFRMTWLGIGQARSIEATWPRGYDCAVPRQRLQEPERVLCQLLREKKLDIVEKNDVGIFCSDHVVKDTRDTGCPLAMR